MKVEEIKTELRKVVPAFAQRIAPVYQVLKWEWSPGKTKPHIPDAREIEKELYQCIDGLTDKYVTNGSGGIEAYYVMPDEEIGEPAGTYGLRLIVDKEGYF